MDELILFSPEEWDGADDTQNVTTVFLHKNKNNEDEIYSELLMDSEYNEIDVYMKQHNIDISLYVDNIFWAIDKGVDTLKKIITSTNQSINVVNYMGDTPLMLAAAHNRIDNVSLLIDNGADIHAINFYNDNAFTIACQNKNYIMAKFLLEHGAECLKTWHKKDVISFRHDIPRDAEELKAYFYICKKIYYKNTYIALLPTDIIFMMIHRIKSDFLI